MIEWVGFHVIFMSDLNSSSRPMRGSESRSRDLGSVFPCMTNKIGSKSRSRRVDMDAWVKVKQGRDPVSIRHDPDEGSFSSNLRPSSWFMSSRHSQSQGSHPETVE